MLDQLKAKILKIRGLTLDSGFDSGETLLLLQERDVPYVVPLRRKGQASDTSNARNRYFEGRHKQIRTIQWKTERSRRLVQTRTLLWKGRPKTYLFAFAGWIGGRARTVHQQAATQRRLYAKRFGIETSYRQKNQGQAFTTSQDPVYRLLLEGVGYLLRQVWVVLTEQIARAWRAKPSAWIGALPLRKMLDWLVHFLTELYPEERIIPINGGSCAGSTC
jgi:hypothetical protein